MKRLFILLSLAVAVAHAGGLDGARCIAPAKPGGGFDLTCQLAQSALQEAGLTQVPLSIQYQPGGIGALAFKNAVTQRPTDARTVVAFSSGSLLNLAQGRFGPYTSRDVHWIASLGLDYGVIAVRQDAPYKTLTQLVNALKESPNRIVFGAGGSIGSQDWMKAALLARAAGVSHKVMRFVAFEGGGEALTALRGDHVQALAGDTAEVARQMDQGAKVRVLAVLAAERLPGRWAQTPTAREQGFDIRWPIVRGLYVGPGVNAKDRTMWVDALTRAMAHPSLPGELARTGFQPAWVTGAELETLINKQMLEYRQLAIEFGVSR
ncbi:tripartite tricarboxylate transporter substrate binding protein [Rhodoferax saidenbachensis]|uniref:Tricarboxylic transporter n=1 Tax=Rhodoferax saidenbachensis TaxID=1484693 RepID=A0A1P8KFI8_9BURK|nr:tripartite tricarboxylate transporter substrate-binding protein [Rhodoferax saidenbachensis]APW44817.1 tricarboxylic transporter [Rhodoferax saidenbachensis]